MRTPIQLITPTLLLFSLMSCASIKPEKRPAYTGADQVGAIDANWLIGTWSVKTINRLKDEPAVDAQVVFNKDGSMTGLSKLDGEDGSGPYGKMAFEMSGNWVIDGDNVNQTVTFLEETTGNPIAKLGATFSLGFAKNKTTAANLYEASADHLIFVNEKDEIAQYYTRVQ